jgi:Mg-chelatase subunit ChlD
MRPDDAIGLVTFDEHAHVIFEPTFKRDIGPKLFDDLDKIKANGGTTIRSGFEASRKLLQEWGFIHDYPKGCENRIIMLTDVCDNSI